MRSFVKLSILSLFVVTSAAACRAAETPARAADAAPTAAPAADGKVFHVVAFRFKTDDDTRAKIPAVVAAFAALKEQSVDAADPTRRLILSLDLGVNDSHEQLSFGAKGVEQDRSTEYTFVLTFANVADRDYYVDHDPAHQAFKALVGTVLEDGANSVFVTDFAP